MGERHDDVVDALARLGDDLTLTRSGEGDSVAAALREIEQSRETAGSVPVRRQPGRRRLRPGLPPRRRVAVAAAAAVVVACTAVVATPGPRSALARLLGIGGVQIVTTSEIPSDLALRYDLGKSLPVDQARAQAPAPLEPAGAGDALAAYAGRPPGGVTLVWAPGDGLPEIDGRGSTGVGLIVTAFPGTPDRPEMRKHVGPSTLVEAVTVGERPGYWISGAPHVVGVLEGAGEAEPEVVRLAGNTLLWADGSTTYRLESALDRAGAVALAESITGGDGD